MVKTYAKKITAIMTAVTIIFSMLLYFPSGTFNNISFGLKASAAEITPTEPSTDDNGVYQIRTAAQLYWFAQQVNGGKTGINAVLTADITVNTGVLKADGTLNTGTFADWTPIGNSSNQYGGKFDGQNHTISGLYFNNTSTDYVGLFGFLGENGEIKNVGVIDSYFSGQREVGGVCGWNDVGTITRCYNTGTVNGTTYVGGVCGINEGKITGCYNTGEVTGDYSRYFSGTMLSISIGGVCGNNFDGTITGCYNTGEATGKVSGTVTGTVNIYVGGVCGYNYITITGSHNTGTVTGKVSGTVTGTVNIYDGGVCGNNGSTITGCYTNGGDVCGGGDGTVSDCDVKSDTEFADGTVCVLLNTALQNANADACFCQGINYPELIRTPQLVNGVYQIGTAAQLYWFAQQVNGGNTGINAVLTADITLNAGVLKADGTLADDTSGFTSWTPIGNKSNKYFGTFNGQGHTVSGLYFKDTGNSLCIGLFGWNNGTVKNIGVIDSYIDGYMNIGGVCGYNESGTITNCYNTSKIRGSSSIGGLCGENSGTISNCYNTGTVSGSEKVGGVCGRNDGTITNCYNTGTVNGTTYVGGVCGYNHGTITNCYFDSTVYNGNAVGRNYGTAKNVKGKTTAQFNSGEVAYLLSQGCTIGETTYDGSIWGQEIGTDPYPVLNGKKVLANVDCSAFANDIIVYGQSASLDGTIGFNIYISADDSYEWDKSVNGVQGVEIENGLYKFTYQVAAKDMDKKINFTVDDKIDVTVCVSDYLAVISETDNAFLKNLADYMSVYGDAAEAYFSGETVAEQTVTDDMSVYDFTVGTMPEGISYYGSSLILKSETTIRHYFKLAEGKDISDYTFSVDGMTVTPTEKQGYYCIDIKNVRAEKLGTSFNVSVNGEEVITNYSALSYVYKVMESDSTDDNLKNLVKALYIYNRNALAYINAA